MDDAEGDAESDAETCTEIDMNNCSNNRYSLWHANVMDYAFLCLQKIHIIETGSIKRVFGHIRS